MTTWGFMNASWRKGAGLVTRRFPGWFGWSTATWKVKKPRLRRSVWQGRSNPGWLTGVTPAQKSLGRCPVSSLEWTVITAGRSSYAALIRQPCCAGKTWASGGLRSIRSRCC